MKLTKLKNFQEMWNFIINNSPLDWFLTWLFWPYIWLWCWLSLRFYKVQGYYNNDKLVAMVIYKDSRLYYLGIDKQHRGKGLAKQLIDKTKCKSFCLADKRLKPIAEHYGFKNKRRNVYVRCN